LRIPDWYLTQRQTSRLTIEWKRSPYEGWLEYVHRNPARRKRRQGENLVLSNETVRRGFGPESDIELHEQITNLSSRQGGRPTT
jgi:hypothetical protein